VKQKKRGRGRPATGTTPHLGLRLPKSVIDRLEVEAAARGLSRSELIRRLLDGAMHHISEGTEVGKRLEAALDKIKEGDSTE
jgi:hypothetical protein